MANLNLKLLLAMATFYLAVTSASPIATTPLTPLEPSDMAGLAEILGENPSGFIGPGLVGVGPSGVA